MITCIMNKVIFCVYLCSEVMGFQNIMSHLQFNKVQNKQSLPPSSVLKMKKKDTDTFFF